MCGAPVLPVYRVLVRCVDTIAYAPRSPSLSIRILPYVRVQHSVERLRPFIGDARRKHGESQKAGRAGKKRYLARYQTRSAPDRNATCADVGAFPTVRRYYGVFHPTAAADTNKICSNSEQLVLEKKCAKGYNIFCYFNTQGDLKRPPYVITITNGT